MNGDLSGGMNVLKALSFSVKDTVFAGAMLVCGFLYWNLIVSEGPGAGITIFALILCGVIGGYLKLNHVKQSKESVICLIIIGLSALNFLLYDLTPLSFFNFIFLSLALVYWVGLITGNRLEDKLSIYFIGDMINQVILVPFYNFLCCFASFKAIKGKGEHGKSVLSALIGILIFFPVLALVVKLLIQADAAFEGLLQQFEFSLSTDVLEYIIQIILGIPVASYLFGLVYGNLKRRNTNHISIESMDKNAVAIQFAPRVPVFSALTVLNGIYILFFFAQGSYLFSGFVSSLPEAMTYAEYARRGFFELCSVAAINLAVIGVAYLITKRVEEKSVPKGLKVEILLVCTFTILLIATALSKMVLYIHYYGLTQLRVYTSWFMALLLFIFILIGVRQFVKFNGSRIVIIGFVLSFLILTYSNVDGMIAKYNIDRYREGTLISVDVEALKELSDGAVPHMYDLYQDTQNLVVKGRLESAITGEYSWGTVIELPYGSNFRNFNIQSYKATQIRESVKRNEK